MPRIGMLTPSSNTVLEPVTAAMLAGLPQVSLHVSRFRVTRIGLGADDRAQFERDTILRAAELLADAKVDVISWNGTSASWLGLDRDRALAEAITAATGIPARTCVLSLTEVLARVGARTLGIVSPYTDDVQARIVETYAAAGFACPAERHLGLADNFSFGLVDPEAIAGLIGAVAAAGPDAVTVLCTNMNGAAVAAEAEIEGGPLMLDSVAVTLWGCLTALGVPLGPLARWGRLFRDPRLAA